MHIQKFLHKIACTEFRRIRVYEASSIVHGFFPVWGSESQNMHRQSSNANRNWTEVWLSQQSNDKAGTWKTIWTQHQHVGIFSSIWTHHQVPYFTYKYRTNQALWKCNGQRTTSILNWITQGIRRSSAQRTPQNTLNRSSNYMTSNNNSQWLKPSTYQFIGHFDNSSTFLAKRFWKMTKKIEILKLSFAKQIIFSMTSYKCIAIVAVHPQAP